MTKSHILLAASAAFTLAAAACSADLGGSEATGTASEAQKSGGGNNGGGNSGSKSGSSSGSSSGKSGSSSGTSSGSASGSSSGSSSGTASGTSSGTASGTSGSSSGSQSCPTAGANDAQQRAAASAAFGIMKAAAAACGGEAAGPCWGTTILASQRYSVVSGGATIQFDPTDPQYSYVPQAAKVALAIAQLDSTVAAFLVAGLQWDQQNTNGQLFSVIEPLAALANFTYPGNSTPIVIQDPAAGNNRRSDVVTGTAWCGGEKVHFADTSTLETGFATFGTVPYNDFYGITKPAYKGSNMWPSTPFNGTGGTANPYLVVSVNGTTLTWNSSSWPTQTCAQGGQTCSGTIDIDPIPYTQPGAYYDVNSALVGPQVNPYSLVITNLYSDPSHAGQWATRTVSGVQQWGTFSFPVTILGATIYAYVKQM